MTGGLPPQTTCRCLTVCCSAESQRRGLARYSIPCHRRIVRSLNVLLCCRSKYISYPVVCHSSLECLVEFMPLSFRAVSLSSFVTKALRRRKFRDRQLDTRPSPPTRNDPKLTIIDRKSTEERKKAGGKHIPICTRSLEETHTAYRLSQRLKEAQLHNLNTPPPSSRLTQYPQFAI